MDLPDTKNNQASKEAELQQRYISLLEARIGQLELVVKAEAAKTPSPADQAAEANKLENDEGAKNSKGKGDGKDSGRYRNILRKWDKSTGAHVDEPIDANFFLKQQSKDVAFTFKRVYNPQTGDKGAYSELDVEDPALIRVLKTEIGKYPGVNFDSDIVTMIGPFAPLVHNWDKLKARTTVETDSQETKDLVCLLERIETAPELRDYFKTRTSNLAAKVVTFNTLWTVFAPDTLVVARLFQNEEQIFKVEDSPIPWPNWGPRSHKMWVWSWDYDGKKMLKVQYCLKFERFRGTKPIAELPYYPLEYHSASQKLKDDSRQRACQFIKATSRCLKGANQMFKYKGVAYAAPRNLLLDKDETSSLDNEGTRMEQENEDEENMQPKLIDVEGEIIVDPEAFIQNGTGKPPLGEIYSPDMIYVDEPQSNTEGYLELGERISKLDLDAELDPDDDNYLIFPPRVLGYATREKVWGQFNTNFMSDRPNKMPDKFDKDLQLDEKYKTLIKALVQSHELAASKYGQQIEDVVQGKGKGLVLLLHGPPGVGKTLTAETIAQATAKPLLVVSVAEIGLDASRAERNLEKLFKLATKWEAVLLVDEADVFLETRGSSSSASRNALVSVLLRVLEYYRGIIILTTNRIKSIDVAVISRIHLAIRYSELSDKQMHKIFKFFLDQLEQREPSCIANRQEIDIFIESYGHHYNLNGRQIRNVVSAALAVARHQAQESVSGRPKSDGRLTSMHLKEVCEMTRDFQEQLKDNTRMQRYNNEVMGPY